MTTNSLAKQTLRRINDAMDQGQTGAIGEIVQTVRRLSGKIAHVSISELSEIIEQDPSVTAKIVSAANTFAYNPSGHEIGSVTEAIHVVGFDRVRSLTLTLMLSESAGKALDNVEQREMASLSVCSGMLAQTLVAGCPQFSADPEIAFVSASLRNYGKLLMSTFFVDEYIAARDAARAGPGDAAYADVFGMTPLELGYTLLQSTNLPELIMKSLERVPPDKLTRSPQSEAEEILVAAEFCVKVSELAFDANIAPENFKVELNKVIKQFSASIPVDFDMVLRALEEVDAQVSQLNLIIGIKDEASPINKALKARMNGGFVPRPGPIAKAKEKVAGAPIGLIPVAGDGAESLEDFVETLDKRITSGRGVDLKEAYDRVTVSIAQELGLAGCMAFLPDTDRSGGARYSARSGVGPLYERIKNRPLVAPDKKDIFGICFARKEDILIRDTKAGKIATVIPSWVHDRGDVTSMIILPVALGQNMLALFVGTKNEGLAIEIEPATHKRLRQLRASLAKAQG